MPEFSISPYGLTITREDGTEVYLSINELAYIAPAARRCIEAIKRTDILAL